MWINVVNYVLIKLMGRTNQIKVANKYNSGRPFDGDYVAKDRLDLNDLLKKRREEKEIDKKTNILIFSGAVTVAAVVGAILSL